MPDEAEADRAQVQILHAAIRDVQAERDAAVALGKRLADVLAVYADEDGQIVGGTVEVARIVLDDARKEGWL